MPDETVIPQKNIENNITQESINAKAEDSKGEVKSEKILSLLEQLNEKFDLKIQNDEWKNQKYDEMHSQMIKYQDDLLFKTVDPLIKSIIHLSDSIKKDIKYLNSSQGQYDDSIFEVLNGIVEQIDAILFNYDIEPMEQNDGILNPKEQRVVKLIITDNKSQDNHIAEILTTGYMRNGNVYRAQRVNLFKYKETEENL